MQNERGTTTCTATAQQLGDGKEGQWGRLKEKGDLNLSCAKERMEI